MSIATRSPSDATPTPSTFGLGTIGWGTKIHGDDLDRLYDAFRNAGGNFFDSAHVYACWLPGGSGASERALGQIVRRRGDRMRVILATKGGHPHMDGSYPRPDRYLAPEVVSCDIDESLERLGVDSIDLYYLHRDDPRVPVGEIIDMLDEHVINGRLRQIGVSNWQTLRIAEANAYAVARGRATFAAHQVKFTLAAAKPSKDPTVPPFDDEEIRWHRSSQLPVHAYSPTANGYFASGGDKGKGWQSEVNDLRLREVNRVALELRATPNQIALAWLRQQAFPIVPILGTTSVEHLQDALGASSVSLTPDQMRSLARPSA